MEDYILGLGSRRIYIYVSYWEDNLHVAKLYFEYSKL